MKNVTDFTWKVIWERKRPQNAILKLYIPSTEKRPTLRLKMDSKTANELSNDLRV